MEVASMKKGNMLLLLAAFVWGIGLVSQQTGMELLGPWSFTAIRCTLGGLSMVPLIVYIDRKRMKEEPGFSWKADTIHLIKPAILCGLMVDLCIIFQQYGLLYTTVSKGSFINGFYIFITPIICVFLHQEVKKKTWVSVVIAMAGLYLMTMAQGIDTVNIGDLVMLAAAMIWAVYIILTDNFVKNVNAIKLSCMQFIFLGLIDFLPAAIIEPGVITWQNCYGSMVSILYAGIVICGVGYTLQMLGQKTANASTASLILSSESIFSMLSGFIILGERLSASEYFGCGLMVIALVIAAFPEKSAEKITGE